MTDALKYEWMRIRTIRSTWWLTTLALLFGTAITFLVSWGISEEFKTPQNRPTTEEIDLLAPMIVGQFSGDGAPFFVPYFLAMLGVFAWGHEYRHGMIRATLTALPSRTSAWVAKYLVVGVWVVLVTLAMLLVSALVGWMWLNDDGVDFTTYDVGRVIVKSTVYSLLFTWVATAFTSIIRQQAAALVLMLLWPLAIENILTLILNVAPGLEGLAPLTRFFPYNAGSRMLGVRDVTGSLFGDPLSPWAGFIVFGAFAAVLMAASIVLFQKRDA